MSEGTDRTVPGPLARLAALRSWASSPARRRIAYAAALALFVVSTAAAWAGLPGDREPIEPGLVALAAALVIPGAFVNAEEYRVSARALGQQVSLAEGLRVAVVAAAFNLLPIPGSVLVRTGALARGGSGTGRAVTSTIAVGVAYIGVALVLVAAVLAGSGAVTALALVVAGGAAIAVAGALLRRLSGSAAPRLFGQLLVVEAASVTVKALRLFLVIKALGFDVSIPQATSLSFSTVAASAIGIFPGGLGIREVLAGVIAPAVDLPATIGLVGTAVDRVVGLTALSILAGVILFLTRDRER